MDTGLNYMDARYEGPNLSRFLSEDPLFLQAGPANWQNAESLDPPYAALNGFVNSSNSVYLASPQNLNPYSHVDDNPLKYRDQTGKCIEDGCIHERKSSAEGGLGAAALLIRAWPSLGD